jgi:hypothetical protein
MVNGLNLNTVLSLISAYHIQRGARTPYSALHSRTPALAPWQTVAKLWDVLWSNDD